MLTSVKVRKAKKCRVASCGASFIPARLGQAVCSPACAIKDAPVNRDKAHKALADIGRREIKVRKEKLKSRGDYLRECQQAFNEFIRWRDQLAGHACVSSGKALDWSGNAVDAGHYRSVGSAPHLRFDERNCHAQSKQDNRFLSGNAVDYRIGLIARIGLESVEALEADQSVRKYTVEQLQQLKADFRAKTRELKRIQA
ncbi:recombination protein NinG [Pseudomonas sp. CCC4.4]|uniref:recombination protein NinG n=1 Tax=Pseudomonas sp. CCC4.4 TaxID=3048612 RepID=UPI002B236FE0|nr:recombination protein NinG [Pseudomonas sp. CCC4.4]MEB0170033.1 recombination protein NinG [Pseudomonas sp. CCC4.4]